MILIPAAYGMSSKRILRTAEAKGLAAPNITTFIYCDRTHQEARTGSAGESAPPGW
jgi:hypothetical protein